MFQYSQNWVIKLCYKPYTNGENKNSFPLNVTLNSKITVTQYINI